MYTSRRQSEIGPGQKSKIAKKVNTRGGTGLTEKTNQLIKPSNTKVSFFKSIPQQKGFKLRNNKTNFPAELIGKQKIIGNEKKIQALYSQAKKIASSHFNSNDVKLLFPDYLDPYNSRLSFMSNSSSRSSIASTSSQIPVFHRSSLLRMSTSENEVKNDDYSFKSQFDFLKKALQFHKSEMIYLIDFCLLYPSLIISLYNVDAASNALDFLTITLQNDFSYDKGINILFSVLLHAPEAAPELFERVSLIIARLTVLEPTIIDRLQIGSTHHNPALSKLCNEVLKRIGQKTGVTEVFTEIKSTDDEESAIQSLDRYVQLLDDNGQPSDILFFLSNIISVMSTFSSSAAVLTRASICISNMVQFCPNCPKQLAFEALLLAFSILSNEISVIGGDPFEISDCVQAIIESIFNSVEPSSLIPAVVDLVAQASLSKLELILNQVGTYVRQKQAKIEKNLLQKVSESLIVFHPEYDRFSTSFKSTWPAFLPLPEKEENEINNSSSHSKTPKEIAQSIERLMNEETVLDEIQALVEKSAEGDFIEYPINLQIFLQNAWLVIRKKIPSSMTEARIQEVINVMEDVENPDTFSSKYSPQSLMSQLEGIF